MRIQIVTLPIPNPMSLSAPVKATSISTPPIRSVLGVSVHAQNIQVEVDCDETQPPVACDWFVVKDGQARPPSGLVNIPVVVNGVTLRVASTCIS